MTGNTFIFNHFLVLLMQQNFMAHLARQKGSLAELAIMVARQSLIRFTSMPVGSTLAMHHCIIVMAFHTYPTCGKKLVVQVGSMVSKTMAFEVVSSASVWKDRTMGFSSVARSDIKKGRAKMGRQMSILRISFIMGLLKWIGIRVLGY